MLTFNISKFDTSHSWSAAGQCSCAGSRIEEWVETSGGFGRERVAALFLLGVQQKPPSSIPPHVWRLQGVSAAAPICQA